MNQMKDEKWDSDFHDYSSDYQEQEELNYFINFPDFQISREQPSLKPGRVSEKTLTIQMTMAILKKLKKIFQGNMT